MCSDKVVEEIKIMDELLKAEDLRIKYNDMSFDEFIKEFEEWLGFEFPLQEKKAWIYTGLDNVDFFNLWKTEKVK